MGIPASILVVFILVANFLLNKLFLGRKKKEISETLGKNVHRWGMVIIGVISIYFLFSLDIFNENVMKWFWLSFIIIAQSFQSFMEWKFLKGSKQYVVSLIVLMLGLIYFFIFMF
ncbi:hypothetical protein CFK37_17950 [Virgibacillus phasianinus]|uniref:DUF4181 domain-containing protein n=1 Tax=Virgibacillus phasianinus TaxID=2017483 RepID=A0A220U6H1_9BACI|nr:DUF4181 domain-containing protein [Virgibacillus phasianinus]ASK63904.1 hypothetical protein CFK37_17950 [Virgibacillus phasianinus]